MTQVDAAIETYELMSQKYFTHATPTLFNAGTPRPQLSSCFLLAMKEDSIEGIYDTLKRCACISKYAGTDSARETNLNLIWWRRWRPRDASLASS